jgi:hypothetical protein
MPISADTERHAFEIDTHQFSVTTDSESPIRQQCHFNGGTAVIMADPPAKATGAAFVAAACLHRLSMRCLAA